MAETSSSERKPTSKFEWKRGTKGRYTREEENFLIWWETGKSAKLYDIYIRSAALHVWLREIHPEIALAVPFRKPKTLGEKWVRTKEYRLSNAWNDRGDPGNKKAWVDKPSDIALRKDLDEFFVVEEMAGPEEEREETMDKMSNGGHVVHLSMIKLSDEDRAWMDRGTSS